MQALLVVDAQNEFSPSGKRTVERFNDAVQIIDAWVKEPRYSGHPVAWIGYFNKADETPAFIPGTWGAQYKSGFGPRSGVEQEKEFVKKVYGAFTVLLSANGWIA